MEVGSADIPWCIELHGLPRSKQLKYGYFTTVPCLNYSLNEEGSQETLEATNQVSSRCQSRILNMRPFEELLGLNPAGSPLGLHKKQCINYVALFPSCIDLRNFIGRHLGIG